MSKIARHMEKEEISEQEEHENIYKNKQSITQVISFIAQDLAEDTTGAKLIVCATTSGFTARNISRFRAGVPLIAVTPSELTRNQLVLSCKKYRYRPIAQLQMATQAQVTHIWYCQQTRDKSAQHNTLNSIGQKPARRRHQSFGQ